MTTYYWKMYFNCTLNFHVFFFLLITGGVCTWLSLPSANNIAFRSSGMIYFSCTYFLKSYKLYQSERIGTTKEKVESEQRIIVSLWITTTVGALRVIRGAKRKKTFRNLDNFAGYDHFMFVLYPLSSEQLHFHNFITLLF